MRKEEFTFKSNDSKTTIKAVRYIPDNEIKAILQIAHGMVEHIDRYDEFAKYLCEKGYLVTGNDHLGHGASVVSKDEWGYFADEDGYNVVLKDMYALTKMTKELYPNVPYFLLGHSMGSFFARYYLTKYPNELDAAIIMGTGQQNVAALDFAKILCKVKANRNGWHYRSKTINALALGSYNKKFEPSLTHLDWLTKDINIINIYAKDPRCTFVFTLNGYYNLFSLMKEIITKKNLENMNKILPVLIVSGKDDPVGDFSKAPMAVYDSFKKVGIKDVTLKLYEDDRHELLNELDKNNVYLDIYNYLESKRAKV